MPRIFQILKNHLPEKNENETIVLKLDNSSQQKDVNEKIKNRLLAFLKQKLNNSFIELTIEVLEQLNENQVIYSSVDKYNYMAEQNEALQKLKKEFNLDFE